MKYAEIRTIIFRRPNLIKFATHPYSMVGLNVLEQMFDEGPYTGGEGVLSLVFPERFLNIVQQRDLYRRITLTSFTECKVYTQSVWLIQSAEGNTFYADTHLLPKDEHGRVQYEKAGQTTMPEGDGYKWSWDIEGISPDGDLQISTP